MKILAYNYKEYYNEKKTKGRNLLYLKHNYSSNSNYINKTKF